ncbi:hypothetical protein [Mycolicibacterium baixiangningiae]|uniref:hypothetical protein n=1 Tax=Mycolicibacterium baixiangningiae TaxID=2761578 RepID=UPI0018D1A527|nr:hypothetical protein [Mycolicibacterium baixiangningiae]
MGSRVRVAASACLVAAGLFLTGLGGAMAFAESDDVGAASAGTGAADPGAGGDLARPDPDRTKTRESQEDSEPDDTGAPETDRPDSPSTSARGRHWPPSWSRLPRWAWPHHPVKTSAEPSSTPATTPVTPSTTAPTTTPSTTRPTTTNPTTAPSPAPAPGDTGSDHDGHEGLPPKLDEPGPVTPSVIDAVPGLPVVVPMAPVAVPVIGVPPIGLPSVVGVGSAGSGSGGSGGGAAPRAGSPGVPAHGAPAQEPAARRPDVPVRSGEPAAVPASFRVGYGEYLRTAGVAQIAAVAVPGTAGIMVLTGLGGLVGYRQAKAGRVVRTESIARFMN